MQIVQTPSSSRGVQINDTDTTQAINTWMLQTPSILGATLSFKQYSSPCLLPGMRQDMREHLFVFKE